MAGAYCPRCDVYGDARRDLACWICGRSYRVIEDVPRPNTAPQMMAIPAEPDPPEHLLERNHA